MQPVPRKTNSPDSPKPPRVYNVLDHAGHAGHAGHAQRPERSAQNNTNSVLTGSGVSLTQRPRLSAPACRDHNRLHLTPWPNHGSGCAPNHGAPLRRAYHFPQSHQGRANSPLHSTPLLSMLTKTSTTFGVTAISIIVITTTIRHLYILSTSRTTLPFTTAHIRLRSRTAIKLSFTNPVLAVNFQTTFNLQISQTVFPNTLLTTIESILYL